MQIHPAVAFGAVIVGGRCSDRGGARRHPGRGEHPGAVRDLRPPLRAGPRDRAPSPTRPTLAAADEATRPRRRALVRSPACAAAGGRAASPWPPSRAGRGRRACRAARSICLPGGRADRAAAGCPLWPITIAFWLVALDEDGGADVGQRPVRRSALARPHLVDHDGDRVRQLVADTLEGRLADQLGDPQVHRLVGHLVRRVERRALGQQPDQQVDEQRRPGTPVTADTGTISAHSKPVGSASCWTRSRWRSHLLRADQVGLGDDGDLRGPAGPRAASPVMNRSPGPIFSSAGSVTATRRPRDSVAAHLVVEPFAEQRPRPVQPGGVDEHELARPGGARCRGRRARVVCGLLEVIATFSPTTALISVDLPALGRPTIDTNPDRWLTPVILADLHAPDARASPVLDHVGLPGGDQTRPRRRLARDLADLLSDRGCRRDLCLPGVADLRAGPRALDGAAPWGDGGGGRRRPRGRHGEARVPTVRVAALTWRRPASWWTRPSRAAVSGARWPSTSSDGQRTPATTACSSTLSWRPTPAPCRCGTGSASGSWARCPRRSTTRCTGWSGCT